MLPCTSVFYTFVHDNFSIMIIYSMSPPESGDHITSPPAPGVPQPLLLLFQAREARKYGRTKLNYTSAIGNIPLG